MCVLVQMCPAVKPDVTAGTTLKKFGSIIWPLTTQPTQSLASTRHLFTHDAWKSTSSWVWGHQRWAWVGRNPTAEHGHSPRDEPWHMTANTRHMRAELDPPRSDTLPGVFLCPVRTASPLPGCSQVVLLASSLLREEGEIIQFSAALFPEHQTGRNDWSRGPLRGNYLRKKTRPSRVTP